MASSTSIAPSVIAGLSSIFLHSSATTTAGSSYITKPTRIPPFSSSSAAGCFLSVRPCLHHFNSLIAITQQNRLLIRTNTSTSNDNNNAGLHPPPPSLIATSNAIFSDEEDADVRYDSSQTDPTSGKVEHHQLDRSKMGSDNPLQIDSVVDQEQWVAKGIKIYAISATATAKRTIVSNLVAVCAKGRKTIVFSQTKRVACEVSLALTYSIACEAFHGDISQQQRERIMNDFRQGKFPLLVTTDITSRGLDMPNVDLVTYYELPKDSETFLHRSSHTGCAGKEGTSFVMVTCSQKRKVRSLESDVEWKFDFVSRQAIGEVLQPLAGQEVAPLSGVFPESVDFSTPTTQKLIGGQGTTARAAVVTRSRKKKPYAKVFALGQHISISAHKARRVIDEIRGRSYEEALMKLGLIPYSACHPIFKLVYSAAANASHSMGSNKANLVVRRAEVDEGTTLKKIKPQSPGRSCAVKRRTCHITIILEDVSK